MRGRRDPQVTMLALVDLEERVPKDHPLRTIKGSSGRSPGASVWGVRPDVFGGGPGVGATGTTAEGVAAHLPLLNAQRAGLLRGAGIQSPVSLVPGHEPDGAQLRPDGVHQEPPASVGAQDSSGPVRRSGAGRRHAVGCCRTSASAWTGP